MNDKQFKILKKITNQKDILPILKNVQIKGNLAFATDLEVAYFTELEETAQIELDGVYNLDSLKLGKPLKVAESDAFPESKEEECRLKIHTNTEAIKKLLCVVGKDKLHPVLENIALMNPDKPYLVGCDGYMISFEPVKVEGNFDRPVIICDA